MQQSELTDQPPKAKEHLDEAKLKIIFEKIKMMFIVKMLKEDGHPNEVIPNLYIGSMGTAYSKDNLLAGKMYIKLSPNKTCSDCLRTKEVSLH